MDTEQLWDRFVLTGSIADYLAYRESPEKAEDTHDNNRGDRPAGTSGGRAGQIH